MIRHIHNALLHHSTARTAAPTAAKTQTDANPFRNVLDAADASANASAANTAAAKPAQVEIAPSGGATINASIIKATAMPTVTLAPPAFEHSPTVKNPDGSVGVLNWTQFADAGTAEQLAVKLGGTVANSSNDMFSATQRSIKVPGSPNLINAGIAAQLFAQYGDKPGSPAWQIINRDLGRDPMST